MLFLLVILSIRCPSVWQPQKTDQGPYVLNIVPIYLMLLILGHLLHKKRYDKKNSAPTSLDRLSYPTEVHIDKRTCGHLMTHLQCAPPLPSCLQLLSMYQEADWSGERVLHVQKSNDELFRRTPYIYGR